MSLRLHALMELMGGQHRRPMQAFGPSHVQIGFVDGNHLDLRREGFEDPVHFLRACAIAVGMAVHENSLRTKFGGGAQRHGGMHAECPRRVRGCGDNAAFVALASDHDGLAFQRWVEQLFDRDEEGVHVNVEDGSGGREHG